jgi:hypothetical protein
LIYTSRIPQLLTLGVGGSTLTVVAAGSAVTPRTGRPANRTPQRNKIVKNFLVFAMVISFTSKSDLP